MTSKNALAIYEKIADPIAAAEKMGTFIAKSQMIKVPSVEAGMCVALTCMAEGMTPFDFDQTYHVINGRRTKKAHAMLVEFRAMGGKYTVEESTPDTCRIYFEYLDNQGSYELTWEAAQTARWPWKDPNDHSKGLKDNWSTPLDRQEMLFARLISRTLKLICPEINFGISTPEEVMDLVDSGDAVNNVVDAQVIAAPTQSLPAPSDPESEPPFDSPQATQVSANDVAVARVAQLIEQVGLTDDQYQGMLKKRGISELHELKPDQADELIQKLESNLKAKK